MRCYSCNSGAVFYDPQRGELVCTRCGLVIFDRVLEFKPEWRTGGDEEVGRADTGVGVDFTFHDLGMGTRFLVPPDASPAERARLRRMQALQKRSKIGAWRERSLRDALIELDKMCEDLAIPKGIKSEACMLYRKVKAKGMTTGRDSRLILAAVIFATCRLRGLPRTEKEVVGMLFERYELEKHKTAKSFRKQLKLLRRALRLEFRRISPADYIDRFSVRLGISRQAVERAHDICRGIPARLRCRSPILLAAVSVYLGAREVGEGLTLRRVAEGFGMGLSGLSLSVKRFKGALAGGSQ
jgi:transcription initiation factor TFIIB